MNGYQRIAAAFRGEWPDRVPIMLHNFMMAAREAGVTMEKFRNDGGVIARCFIEAVEKYKYDGIVLDIDTVTLAGAAGVPIDFPRDEPARLRGARLKDLRDVPYWEVPDIRKYRFVQVWLEAATRLQEYFEREVCVRGNCDQSPFTLSSMVRGIDAWMMDLLDEEMEEFVRQLLEKCTEVTLQFVRLMAETGVRMISNGDSVGGPGLISPLLYRKYAFPYQSRVVDEAHRIGVPYILHICGKTDAIIDDMLATATDGLELDCKTDALLAHAKMRDSVVFLGNIDPSGVLALGSIQTVEEKTLELLRVFADTPRFVLNAGCAIPSVTPQANLRAMIRAAREFTGRAC